MHVESSGVWTFVVGVELAVQSQRRRTTVHDTHSCSQHCLVLERVSLELLWPVDVGVQGTRRAPETAE